MWSNVILPIIEKINANYIIEIGSDEGINTENILKFCMEHNAHMAAIDPFPNFDVEALKSQYGDRFEIYNELSLNILPLLENYDVILLDGDHNWYTVYNELKIIENTFKNKKFPIIFLHDISWPYARRDLYYNPENIPEDYRQPYKKLGMIPGQTKLKEEGGLNSFLYNSIYENNPHNGVLTAVEEFIDESDLEYSFSVVNAYYGLGILYPKNEEMDNIVKEVIESSDLIKCLEEERINLLYTHNELNDQNISLQRRFNENKINLGQKREQLKQTKKLLETSDQLIREKDFQLKQTKRLLETSDQLIQEKESQLNELNFEIDNLKADFYELDFLTNNHRSWGQRLVSKFPSLYILLRQNNNGFKYSLINIKGYKAIKKNNLFNFGYYLKNNKDIRLSGVDPLIHYIYHGFKEGRRPNPSFDGNNYLKTHKDVKKSGLNPLIHYALYGNKENRKKTDLEQKIQLMGNNQLISKKKTTNRIISVVVTSYNHEKYIQECIDSILMQKGNFELELILGDDDSQDGTRRILEEYHNKYPKTVHLLPKAKNMGVTKNLKRCFKEVNGDYVAVCEGDDYWTDPSKLQKQANFLDDRPDCIMCFNSILMSYEGKEEKNYIFQENLTKNTFTTHDLILDNFIGNFSCCMYRTNIVKKLPDTLYDIFIVDWMFNIACSEYGNIGFLNDNMTVYRIHDNGLWSSKDSSVQISELSEHIDTYNEFLSFKYDSEFKKYQKRILDLEKEGNESKKNGFQDIIILDDVFPHPLSAFRLQEYNSYLEHFNKMKIYCNPLSFPALNEKRPLEIIIEEYENEYPQFKGNVEKLDAEKILQAKAVYTIFIANTYRYIDVIEKFKIPFVFTLYPGGGFELNNKISDEKLERVFSSPYFRKVIVTQKIVHDYLIDNNFCKAEQIEEIFGIVTPLELLTKEYFKDKQYFGKYKKNLDICFVAHKYTEKGVDKGYDVFIEVAHELIKKYDNIHFHVVGNFDENVLDITQIRDKINFYGTRLSKWFDEFYNDKDIILSPNIPFKLFKGSFDGFPTGCCTEAGLNKLAIFCTDELNMNTKFEDEKEIVIIPHDTKKIVEIIEKYYYNPEKLQEIAQEGYLKIKELYNYENQIMPRIKILEELIKSK